MAGRGRGLTLPAWMTAGGAGAAPGAAAGRGVQPHIGMQTTAPPPGASNVGAAVPPPAAAPPAGLALGGAPTPSQRVLAPPRPAPVQQQQQQLVWTQHTAPDGRLYYYNKTTKKSTFAKPTELMTPHERKAHEADATTEWRENRNASGRVYFFNVKSRETTWVMPEEIRKAREAAGLRPSVEQPSAPPPPPSAAAAGFSASATTPTSRPVQVPAPPAKKLPLPSTMAAAALRTPAAAHAPPTSVPSAPGVAPAAAFGADNVGTFNALLESAGVTVDSTWESTMRRIITDKRYMVLRSLAEKKNAFNTYVEALIAKEKERMEERVKGARDAFAALLERRHDAMRAGARWREIESLLGSEPEFVRAKEVLGARAVEDETIDFVRGLERRQREQERELKRKHAEAFRAALRAQDWVRFDTSWRKVLEHFFDSRKEREGDGEDAERHSVAADFREMDRGDAVEIFEEYVQELDAKEKEKRHGEREERRRAERDNRAAFAALLASQRSEGRLDARSRWKDFVAAHRAHPTLVAVSKNLSGSTPRELFSDVVDELYEEYRAHKTIIRGVMKARKCELGVDTSLADFQTMLQGEGGIGAGAVSDTNLRFVWVDEVDKAKEMMDQEDGEVFEDRDDIDNAGHFVDDDSRTKSKRRKTNRHASLGDAIAFEDV